VASRYHIATRTLPWAPTGLLVLLPEIRGLVKQNQVPTYDVKVDWEAGWPVDTLLQLEQSLGLPLSSWSGFLRCNGLVKKKSADLFV